MKSQVCADRPPVSNPERSLAGTRSNRNSARQRAVFARAIAAVALLGATLFGFAGAASASSAAGTCVTVEFGGNTGTANANLLDSAFPVTPQVAIDLPAGDVTIPEAVSTDSYPSRVDVVQTSEIWVVEFIGADGSIVGTSAQTTDVPDNVEFGEWTGPLGTVTLSAPAVAIQAAHRPDVTDDPGPNSVRASEVTICTVPSVCPTNADGTPVDPDDPTCPDTPACEVDADGMPVDPADPDCVDQGGTCELNADGTPVDPTAPGCPDAPAPAPECPTNADGTPVDPTAPGCPDAPTPPPAPAPECPRDDSGQIIDPLAPGCDDQPLAPAPPQQPTQTPTQTPTQDPAPAQPTLPVTGAETSVFLYTGMWLLAAGTTLVMFVNGRKSALR